jgi:ElaB/YqjD/DUF883 family membrane-anchored ribosome-binding protein
MPDTSTRFGSEANNIIDQAAETTRQVGNTLSDAATSVKDKTQELGRAAKERIDEQRVATASKLRNVASGLHENAGKLPNGPQIAHSAASRIDAAADYLESRDANGLMADVGQVVKRNPIPSLLIAAVAGFFVGRVLSNNR